MLLEVRNLTVHYGSVRAIEDVSFQVSESEIVALIGPNGAGKSTSLKAVTGLLPELGGTIMGGTILSKGKSIRGLRTDLLVRQGIVLVPEGRRVFSSMTVRENLEMGGFTSSRPDRDTAMDAVLELFPRLKERLRQSAGTLSSGEQQMLAIGRGLMLKPRLLLADEPSLGLSPNFVELIYEKFAQIKANGTSILLVEQNIAMALEAASRAYVFETGRIRLEGNASDLVNNQELKKTFLGA